MKKYLTVSCLVIASLAMQACGGGGGSGSDDGGTTDGSETPDGGTSGGGTTDGGTTDGGTTGGGTTDGSTTGDGPDQPDDDDPNSAPEAYDISLLTDRSSPIFDVQLIGDDPDNDTLVYVLDSSRSGNGYSLAFVEAEAGILHVVLDDSSADSLAFDYRVTDGVLYSQTATLSIDIGSIDESGLGANDIPPEDYSAIDIAYFGDELFGEEDGVLPDSIDLSNNFPPPGDQGRLGSCVGWAVGYALKSYHEKVEEQWEFSSKSTLFSPSWIYNQINGGVDQGSLPSDALQLIVDSGAATLSTMPYNDVDFSTQPGTDARSEAGYYKAASFAAVRSLDMVKRSLASRTPVTIGIDVYDSLNYLSGSGSVYSNYAGASLGGHAVTIVGYDDNAFGGAFKVINSWGTEWGDGGFFWLPYSGLGVVSQAYVLIDAPNSGEPPEPVQPPADDTLPNLIVSDWTATYDPKAGGTGELQWRVTNSGASVARAGADINLILSRDERIDPTDILVVYEELPVDLAPGESLFRDDGNPLSFSFPLDMEAGEYYMAVWVDDLDEVAESNDADNISYGSNLVSISEAQLPDLVVDSWWASWDISTGAGELEYRVSNVGNVALNRTDWDINLVLSTGTDVVDTFAYYLFYEDGSFELGPNETVFRAEGSRAQFNVYESSFGQSVVPGDYYMSLWVDDTDVVVESREYNNLSSDNAAVRISRNGKSRDAGIVAHRFNGKTIPTDTKLLGKVTIETTATGEKKIASFSKTATDASVAVNGVVYDKANRARDPMIFPIANEFAMAEAKAATGVADKVLVSQ